jgi:galactoside O-acetyltransferase
MLDYSFYSDDELALLGFKKLGRNVQISKTSIQIGKQNISIGDNSRIDALSILSASEGSITIGRNVHVASFCSIQGGGGVSLEDYSGLSHGVKLFSLSDDYSGSSLTNPTIPEEFLNIKSGPVLLQDHVIVGANSVILPDLTVGMGSAVGALSLVNRSLAPLGIYSGIPAKLIKPRANSFLSLAELLESGLSEKEISGLEK